MRIILTIFFVFLFIVILSLRIKINIINNEQNIIQTNIENWKEQNKKQINLQAEKYLIYNLDTKKLIKAEKNDVVAPLASISKIITIATFLKTFKEKNLNIEDKEFSNIKSKIQKALIQSDNEDAEELGVIYKQLFDKDLLNDCNLFIQSLGINNYRFINLTGLDIKNDNGLEVSNLMSLNDLNKIFNYIYDNQKNIYEITKFSAIKTDNNQEIAINTNNNVERTYGLLISKTGFTDLAKGNLATIINYAPKETYLIIILQSTKEGRFTDLQKIISILSNL